MSTLHMNTTLAFTDTLHKWFFRADPNALHASDSDRLFMGIFWLSAVIFVALMVLMVYWVIKYRRRPGTIAQTSASHNTPLEIAWTVIPLGILAVMFFEGFEGYMKAAVAPAGALDCTLTAQQWDWSLAYPDGSESTEQVQLGDRKVKVFYVPADVPVRLRMNSLDVLHSFWVPDFRGKFDVMPNRYTMYWFQAEKPEGANAQLAKLADGTEYKYTDHWVFCAEYCGDSHSEMTAIIRVVPEDIFNRKIKDFGTPSDPTLRGQALHVRKCASCHSNDGTKSTGPTWKDLFGREETLSDGSKVMVDENYVRESILVPQAKLTAGYGNQMNSFQGQVTEEDINGIIAYMKSISVHAAGAKPAGEAPAAETKPAEAAPAAK